MIPTARKRFRAPVFFCFILFVFLLAYGGWFFYSTGTSLKAADTIKSLQTRRQVEAALRGWMPRRLNVAGSDFARSRWSQIFEEKEPGYVALRYTLRADICVDVYFDRNGRKVWVQSND